MIKKRINDNIENINKNINDLDFLKTKFPCQL